MTAETGACSPGKKAVRLSALLRCAAAAALTACFVLPAARAAENATQAQAHGLGAGQAVKNESSGRQVPPAPGNPPRRANFENEPASVEATQFAHWIMDSRNNQGMPFVILDKVHAKVFVFHANGRLRGASAALLGLARGDDSSPGIGTRKLSAIAPAERTTPAGRFVASLDRDTHGIEMLWVDYEAAISLHRVVTGTAAEKRAHRLNSATASDNRISYGCINVPVRFYDQVVSPAFTGTNGVVYVLPETRSAREVFGSYDVSDAIPLPTAASTSRPAAQ